MTVYFRLVYIVLVVCNGDGVGDGMCIYCAVQFEANVCEVPNNLTPNLKSSMNIVIITLSRAVAGDWNV